MAGDADNLRLRRGTTTKISTYKGKEGEIGFNTTEKAPVVFDGTTAGGHLCVTETKLEKVLKELITENGGTIPTE